MNQGSDICYGYIDQIKFNNVVVYDVDSMNVRGNITKASIGGNATQWGYDSYGNITSSAATGIQGYTYTPNTTTGNLTSRSNSLRSLTESFFYDNLDRLDYVTKSGVTTLDLGYDTGGKGNITTKSDAGTLVYDLSGKPYAVGHVTPYTANFPADSLKATYTSFGKVNTLTYGPNTWSATFKYNADNERIKMVISQSGTPIKTKYYFGGSYEKVIEGATTTEYIWIGGDPYTAVAVAKIVNGGTPVVYAIFRDNLGTITHLKSSSETLEYSFDAYGRRRDKDDWSYTLTSEPALFADRGFTGHEHLTQFGLINMNGRLYDPLVGRFLSPDNSVQNPYFTQNYNRYSYCLNNPLRYSDPSGNTYKPIYWDEAIGGGSSNGIIRTFGHFDFSGYNARADAYFAQGGYRYNATYGIYTNGLGQAVSWQTAVYGSFLNTGGFSEINDLNEYVYNGRGDYYGNGSYISNENGKYDIFVEVPEFQISLSAQGGGGWYDNAGVYITGAVLTAEDVYNNYYHNHATYFLKNGTERTILNERGVVRNSYLARNAANISTTVKVLGTTGSALMTAQAGTKIYNGNATAWDYGDFTVGSVGTVAGAAELIGGASYAVPGVGEAVAAYSWFRLWFDLGAQYGPSKWYGNDDTSWFK